MSQQAHYFKIGLFVVGAIALAVIGIIVLGAGKWLERSTMVETYFFESVQGLEIAALDVDLVLAAEHDRPEAVPLGLIEEPPRRELLGDGGQHGLDRRVDGEIGHGPV